MKNNLNEYKVSVIMPTYNAEKYIKDAIDSVINQTYKNWEIIIVDDNSEDNTEEIVKEIISNNKNISYIKLNENMGAATTRNKAMELSSGRFLAFLDSDDIWAIDKLEVQISYMIKNKCAISYSDYELISDDGYSLHKVIRVPQKLTYKQYLRNTIIQTVTVVVDKDYVGDIRMPNIKMRQDFATWLSILKNGHDALGINKVLGQYRRTTNSLSSNKFKTVQKNWYVYRKIEKLSLLETSFVFTGYAINATIKRINFKMLIKKARGIK